MRWKAEAAGESEICEEHYQLIRSTPSLTALVVESAMDEPDERFTDKAVPQPDEVEVFEAQSFEEHL